ncbi:ABC transporter permease subunit [Rhizobiales bacterium]|uniref:ABC transporter permease subunit n=1 Tax=Hongsoonwoonella zoysiae TaxID=2821844 RepID=UPI00155FFD15|nr:ABC transporter permease subunit [Hongsoonwoonella zoysiae]NRG16451.1 ABC transporter permease subunit [Hongsoonwoonella zoysiae]
MKKVQFQNRWIPYLLLLPQLSIVAVFFLWPAAEAVRASFFLEDPFGFGSTFVGFDNFIDTVSSSDYLRVTRFTVVFTFFVTFFSLGLALLLAVKADKVLHGSSAYKTLLMWVYAVAPPVAGLIGILLFDQHVGPIVDMAALVGWKMQIGVNYFDTGMAMTMVAVWKQIPVNFIFFLSGLQGISKSVQEAAAIDCRSGIRRFWTVTFPLLAPTGFFLLIINITYAFFDTFGIIDVMLKTQPGNDPITLVYKVYQDGFRGNDLGGSSAQSVILMLVVFVLTIVQFRLIERRVHYT